MNFLLEDSSTEKVPKLLEDAINKILSKNEPVDLLQKDIFFVLIIVLMVENGLLPVLKNGTEWDRVKAIDKDQLCEWKRSEGAYEAIFYMSGFNDVPVKLILCPLGSSVAVNLLISYDKTDVYTTFLQLNRYVVSPKAATIPMIFNDLEHLSYTYKNKIIAPAKSKILSFYGYPSASLVGLPDEIFFHLMLYLPLIDVINVSKTCKRLMSIIEDDNFWHKLFNRDFKKTNLDEDEEGEPWKLLYMKKYGEAQEKKLKACRLTGTLRTLSNISNYPSHIDNPHLWALLFE